jgi:hypothetical protein
MHFTETEDSHSFSKLTESGRIVVSAMRAAPSGAATTMACFVDAFGERRGRPCFVVFLQIVHALALFGRRRMKVGSPGWPILTHDEVAFLQCIDAAVRGDETARDAHLAWLVRRHGAEEFGGYVRTLAGLMTEPLLGSAIPAQRPGAGSSWRPAAPEAKRPAPVRSASASPVMID